MNEKTSAAYVAGLSLPIDGPCHPISIMTFCIGCLMIAPSLFGSGGCSTGGYLTKGFGARHSPNITDQTEGSWDGHHGHDDAAYSAHNSLAG